ncbi:MAG TPA: hypothetical protein VHX38_15505 [Pseudonocardiaceae bacterium]|jgi:hypothetical protein|nr:hypothetical protein [Pseudonocardiaceae bacterium]
MDEDRLAQLLHDAVPDPPPATFDADDVLNASRRLTARRRSVVRGTSMAAIVLLSAGLLTGLGVVGLGWFGHTGSSSGLSSTAAGVAGPSNSSRGFQPKAGNKAGPELERPDVPTSSPMQGGGGAGSVGPTADSTPGGCGSTDGELAVALAGELPSVGDPRQTGVPAADCPSDARSGAAYSVHDNGANGVVVAVLRPGTDTHTPLTTGSGTAQATVATKAGDTLTVLSQPQPAGGVIPFADKVTSIADALATRF